MPTYDAIGTRTGTGGDLPEQFSIDVLDDLRTSANIMRMGTVIQTKNRDSRIPVITQDVDAYWVNGDAGLKGVSAPVWESKSVYAEELAVVVPVPDSVVDDASGFPIWEHIRHRVSARFAAKLDAAALFGVDKPTSWSPSLYSLATTSGQVVESTDDPAADLLAAAEVIADQDLQPTGFMVRSGWEFNASATRARPETVHGSPVDSAQAFPLTLAGCPIVTRPPYWDKTKAVAMVSDFRQTVVGVRQDLTFSLHTDGVITDEDGKVVLNLLQADSKALRCVMRIGVHTRRPARSGTNIPTNPVAIVEPAP